ncbi:acylphosphatase [Ruminococcaceae bacterium FB2012]|nr:acylphosphatase [Ruminococcaceae bacterium FB2012]
MERIRKHIIFHGFVQGVGFRYRMYYTARANGVSGWVRNLYDGTVEAELEGTESAVDMTVMQIENARFIHIESMDIRNVPIHNDHDFEII